MIWSLIQSIGGQGVILLVYLLLATMLSPEDFGLVGLATVWIAVLSGFAELGFGAALVQRREISESHASTTFGANMAAGIILAVLGVAISWPVAASLGEPRLRAVLAALSAGFVLRAPGLAHAALAQRHLRFRVLAIRDIAANTVGGGVGLVLAVRGCGVWSLVAVSLVAAAVGSALLWISDPWRPSARQLSATAFRELWQFSSSILGFNLFKAVVQNIDRLVIGYLLGTAAVGFYSLASRLVVQPLAVPVGALGVYLFPKVSRAQDDPSATQESYRTVLALCLAIAVPYVIITTWSAPALVPRLFGPEWRPAVTLVGWLGVVALVRSVFSPAAQMMKALGRPDLMLRWSIAITAVTLVALFAGAAWGIEGVAAAFAAAHVLALPVLVRMVRTLSGFGAGAHLATARRALVGGVVAATVLTGLTTQLPRNDWLVVGATIAVGTGLAVWLLLSERGVAHQLRAAVARRTQR